MKKTTILEILNVLLDKKKELILESFDEVDWEYYDVVTEVEQELLNDYEDE